MARGTARSAPTARRAKPEGSLAHYAVAKKAGTQLIADVTKHLIVEAGMPTSRRQDVIHPSEMAKRDWCPLSTYLRIQAARAGKLLPSDPNRLQTELIFDAGHEYHRKWQGYFERMKRLYGRWWCLGCGHHFHAVSPDVCTGCGEDNVHTLVYEEVGLHDEAFNIHGHADGIVTAEPLVHVPSDPLIEIKSIGEGTIRMENPELLAQHTYSVKNRFGSTTKVLDHRGAWSGISMPFGAHLRQGWIYCRLAEKDEIIFLYEYKPTSLVKQFVVKRNDAAIDPLWDHAADIMYAINHGGEPPRCVSDNGRCSECAPYREDQSGNDQASAEDAPAASEGSSREARAAAARAARRA